MELTKTQAQQNLSALLEKFQRELESGRAQEYNEEATKTAFIQPLLKEVLGWDVTNRDEVSPEERTSRGRVDYGLKLDGKIKVFVEAKPVKAELDRYIQQAVGYGYNYKNVPFVLLTDFEGLKLFDVTVKPDARNPKKGLKLNLTWVQYRSQFDKLWLLSRESVIAGELDKLLLVKPKDRVPVDKAILDDLKEWREDLAKEIFKHNRALFNSGNREQDAQYLKEITQRLLDRFIFMRFCEDRQLTHRQSLKELFESRTDSVGLNTIVFLKEEFKHYDLIFDSDLFSKQDWEENLQLEFKVLKSIILGTYNPYQFDVIPLEVLGNIYEQYLGYTIRLTDQQVKYELKPDVRKAGGVYYTPEYIVDYIVQNTVGKLLQELPANRIKKLRILDPACGSGSFLIRAYAEMLKYYLNQKKAERADVIARSPALKQHEIASLPLAMTTGRLEGGTTKQSQSHQTQLALDHQETEITLSIEEKSRILQEHIFGVDIDEQAVEVTKLSLMLKMLEGEYGIIPGRGILPMLDRNIKCGNSLISGSSLELKQYFGDDWYKVKPFNWYEQFKPIMVNEKGFDVVISNPPYIKMQMLQEFQPKEVSYIKRNYLSASTNSVDIYVVFIEKAISLLSNKGIMGYICPHKFFNSNYGTQIRSVISKRKNIIKILHFGINQVFENATTYTCLLFLSGFSKKDFQYFEFKNEIDNLEQQVRKGIRYYNVNSNKIIPSNWVFVDSNVNSFMQVIQKGKKQLGEITTNIFQGPKSGADPVFILKFICHFNGKSKCYSYSLEKDVLIEKEIIKPYIKGKLIKRYLINRGDEYIIYPYDIDGNLLSENDLAKRYPLAYKYLSEKENKKVLFEREDGRFKNIWWSYSRPQNMKIWNKEKILTPFNAFKNSFCYDNLGDFIFSAGVSGAYGILLKDEYQLNYKYLLAILNSFLIEKYLKTISTALRGSFYSYENKYIKQLPIPTIDFSNPADKKLHDDLVGLVEIMLDLNQKLPNAKGTEKDRLQNQINQTDREIDQLVYKLYNITNEEQRIIEGN